MRALIDAHILEGKAHFHMLLSAISAKAKSSMAITFYIAKYVQKTYAQTASLKTKKNKTRSSSQHNLNQQASIKWLHSFKTR